MQDDQLADLCKKIYRKHRDAIDLIVEYGSSSIVLDVCAEVIPGLVECEFVKQSGGRVWFLPNEMSMQDLGDLTAWFKLPRDVAIACWFEYGRKKGVLRATMEVGPISDSATRRRLLEAIRKAGFSFKEKGLRNYLKTFSRLYQSNAHAN